MAHPHTIFWPEIVPLGRILVLSTLNVSTAYGWKFQVGSNSGGSSSSSRTHITPSAALSAAQQHDVFGLRQCAHTVFCTTHSVKPSVVKLSIRELMSETV